MPNHMSIKQLIKSTFDPKKISRYFHYAFAPGLVFYALSLFILKQSGFSTGRILRDPFQLFNEHSMSGFLSNVGNFLWISSASICFFEVITQKFTLRDRRLLLLLLFGSLCLLLGIDDFFMIHDRYINEKMCYGFYACLALVLLIACHKTIMEIDGFSFMMGGACLALSILTDIIQDEISISYNTSQIIEEAFKFIGIVTWLYFSVKVASARDA